MSGYPAHLETDVVLRDGTPCTSGRRCPRISRRSRTTSSSLSDESRRLRFAGPVVDVGAQARDAVQIDYVDHLTLLAFMGADRRGSSAAPSTSARARCAPRSR